MTFVCPRMFSIIDFVLFGNVLNNFRKCDFTHVMNKKFKIILEKSLPPKHLP